MAGLLDYLYNSSTYGGDGGGILNGLMPIANTYQQQPMQTPAGFPGFPANAMAQGQPAELVQQPQQPQPQPISIQPQQSTMPTFLQSAPGGGGFGDHLIAGLQNFANGGGILPALAGGISGLATGSRTDPLGMQQQNLRAQYEALVPTLGPQKAMLAVMNPEAGKVLLTEALTSKQKFQKIGSGPFGDEQYGFVNERDQTINGSPSGAGGAAQSSSGFLAPGVAQINSQLNGEDYLGQFSPEVQAAVKNYVAGKSTPTGNPRKGFTQAVKMIAQKYGEDIGQPTDDVSFAARKTMRNQLSSSAPSSLGGQINIGNTAAGHLADLSQRALELGNVDTGIAPVSGWVNKVRGLGTEQAAKMEALKGAAQHYGQEITKFYAGSPGGVAERDRFIESVNGARSPKELAAILATEAELMRSRLDALGGQIKGVLGEEGMKQYPVLRPDGQAALVKVEENVSRLRGHSAPKASLPSGWSVQVR